MYVQLKALYCTVYRVLNAVVYSIHIHPLSYLRFGHFMSLRDTSLLTVTY